MIDFLTSNGAKIKRISVPLTKYVLAYHYSLIPSEAASNLARYDGLRFGNQVNFDKNLFDSISE